MLGWLISCVWRKPDVIIGPEGYTDSYDNAYMLRWHVIPRNRWFNIYLHKILRDDEDRAMHDHPAASLSVVLRGGYYEITQGPDTSEQRRWHGPGSVITRWGKTPHRVELAGTVRPLLSASDDYPEITCISKVGSDLRPSWSLFFLGPRTRVWGFHCPLGWRPWTEFYKQRSGRSDGDGCG